ncbi:MAG: IS1 family transposase [Acidobacteriota bacterium]|nr:IS1 family transposase [Acidobacteriota bacterium]MDE2962961.1 IS1 family transposase [Acidobacteriota bacterium]
MNKLTTAKRAMIINMLVEGSSLRSISRVVGVSINTVSKLLVDAGKACAQYHNEHVRKVAAKNIQVDEIWQFCYAKEKNVPDAKAAPEGTGDIWTWTALDTESRLIVSWLLGDRGFQNAYDFMADLAERLTARVQLVSDGLKLYKWAIEAVFGADIDFAQLVKIYGLPEGHETRYSPPVCTGTITTQQQGRPDPDLMSTSYVEWHNLTMRMSMRRFTRLTNAFSKKLQNHAAALALYFVHYNFCRVHKALRVTPAMEAGLADTAHDADWIVGLVDAAAPTAEKPGPKRKTRSEKSKSN